jgi:hypothetical protein
MNPEIQFEKDFSAEGQKNEIIYKEAERFIQEEEGQFDMLPEDQRQVLESIKNESFEILKGKIEEKLAS